MTAVAEADAAAIRALTPHRVEVVPNGVDADRFRPDPAVAVGPDTIVFVGAMSFGPNVAAVAWFATEVLPRLRANRPSITFTIVGRDPAPAVVALAGLPGVTVTGSVDDVRPWLSGAAVVVAPLVSGSGSRTRSSRRWRWPVRSSAPRWPSRASPPRPTGTWSSPTGPAAFAAAVLGLLDDPARAAAVAAGGRALVEAVYTWDACAASYAGLYADLASPGRPR